MEKFAAQRAGNKGTSKHAKKPKAKKMLPIEISDELLPQAISPSPQNSEFGDDLNSPSEESAAESLQSEAAVSASSAGNKESPRMRHPHADLKGRVKYFKTMPVDEQYKRCSKIVDVLVEKEGANVFREEVPREIYPDYYRQIKKPMYVDLIIEKLRNKMYKHMPMGFAGDMRLVWRNCMAYNNEDSNIHQIAKSHSAIFERLFEEWVVGGLHEPAPLGELNDDECQVCKKDPPEHASKLLLCDRCDGAYHLFCLEPPLQQIPTTSWYLVFVSFSPQFIVII